MKYNYQEIRPNLFTETGVAMLLVMLDKIRKALETSGAFKLSKVMVAGDSWLNLAAADYLVELGYLIETSPPSAAGQDRVFISGGKA